MPLAAPQAAAIPARGPPAMPLARMNSIPGPGTSCTISAADKNETNNSQRIAGDLTDPAARAVSCRCPLSAS